MSEIDELQQRIAAALDRIGQGLEQSGDSAVDSEELDGLRQALDDEKLANEQLQERLKANRGKIEGLQAELDKARTESAEAMSKLDRSVQSLRKANAQLRENNNALREANEAGVGEPHLINKSMMAELEGLRAARAVDQAEQDAIMNELSAAIDGAANAQSAGDA